MKTLCPKPSKGGKIHPSPVEDPIRAAFRLLPAAILVLVAGLGPEDREVLAYLVTLPIELDKEAAAAVPHSEQPAARGGGGRSGRRRVGCAAPALWVVGHPPTHGCGCFECYISFWARWNCSPERDRILDALQAFEEHLAAAAAESPATPPSSSRRRARRSRLQAAPPPPPPPLPMPLRRPKSPVPQVFEVIEVPASPLPPSFLPPPLSEAPTEEEEKAVPEPAAAPEPECCEVEAEASEEERKRGWADVMGGVLGLRLWGIWSPAVESAT